MGAARQLMGQKMPLSLSQANAPDFLLKYSCQGRSAMELWVT
jgi:hypothetical protein